MPNTTRTVVAVFDDHAAADRAVADLVSNGFSRQTIQINSNSDVLTDSAMGNTGLSGREPRDTSGGGISGFFRRMFGDDNDYAGHYDEAVRRGSVVVSVETDEDDLAGEILDRNGAIDVDERAATWGQEGYGATSGQTSGQTLRDVGRTRTDTDDQSIPVVREELHVGKRDVQRGGVRVFSRVTEQPVQEQIQLRDEHVTVDRRNVNRPATEADFRAQDEVIEVTAMGEEPVIAKSARVVEEVIVGKETTQRTETVHDTLRRTDVDVEKIGGGSSLTDYDDDFQNDFQTRYRSTRGATYETYGPAYQYGYRMASDERYRGRDWDEVETNLRTDYERNYPGGKWEQMKDAVRFGWGKMTGRR